MFLVLYFIRGITLLLYSKIRNKRLIFDGSFLLSIINTFWVTYSFIRYYTSYSVGADKSTATGTMSILQRGLNDGILRITISNTISMWIQWIYVLIVLKASKTFGPMIETINTMIVNILKFSWIFWLIFIWFSTIGRICFFDVTPFQTFPDSFVYLLNAIFGQIDFTVFDGDHTLNHTYGYLYLWWFIVILNIVMLNLLIAILTSIYESINKGSNSLYLNQMIKINHLISKNPLYSSLSYSYVPINIVTMLFFPFLLMKSK